MGNYCSSKPKDGGSVGGGSDECLQKKSYKKQPKTVDKSTNVIAVKKRGKNNTAVTTVTATTNNNASNNVAFKTSKIDQPEEFPTIKPAENLNVPPIVEKVPEKSFIFTLPEELKFVSTETKKLLLGVFEPTKNQKTNKIVIYVCISDNKGFLTERDCLYGNVLPAVRAKCIEAGYEFHVVDLYCGHQQELSDPSVRLAELHRQHRIGHVVPVVLVDGSLGPPVLPRTMTRQDFEAARAKTDVGKLIERWYTPDAQKNHYELRNETMFETTFETQEADEKQWYDEKIQLQIALMKAFESKFRSPSTEQIFQQEVLNKIVVDTELAKRSVWLIKSHDADADNKYKSAAAESKKRLEQLSKQLKNELPEINIIFFEDNNVCEVAKKIFSVLSSIVESVDKEREKNEPTYGVDSLLLEELRIQTWFAQDATKLAVCRDETLERIKKYLMDGDAAYPLVLYGPSGSGKTTALSALVQYCHSWNQNAAVVARFANASVYSSSLEQTLNSLTVQLDLVDSGKSNWFKHDVQSYSEQIKSLLASIGQKRPVILVADGFDQFSNNDIGWIPASLPDNVKLVVSTTEPSAHLNLLRDSLKTSDSFFMMPQMTDEQIDALLASIQVDSGAETTKNGQNPAMTPLNIQVNALCSKIRGSKQPSENWLEAIFDSVELLMDKEKVSVAIGYMCATRYGILDSEVVELLSSEDEFRSNHIVAKWSSAGLFWAIINQLCSPFLYWFKTDRYATVRWKNAVVAEVALRRYGAFAKIIKNKMLSYYNEQSQIVLSSGAKESLLKRRKLDECIHLMDGAETIKENFNNLDWVLDKLNNGLVLQLLDELLEFADDPQARFLRDFLSTATPAVMHNGNQLFSQMSLYPPAFNRYRALIDAPPFATLMPLAPSSSPPPPSSSLEATNFDVVKRLNEDSNYVITVSTGRQEINVWDVHGCTRVRTLKGLSHPTALKLIDNQRCIVLCERKLTVINLDTGKVISKLKGVMNQNMPYFGLHSSTKVVALARSRMHVNLIDIETGTIEAYFKAGEDRFLNSLLVSGNGRVMVCGDETQKPFPLLVWNLTSRQLMYDLRIPFHEFITRLAAITYEGHFVCCVAQEVDEPGPNFIVVYDLQSGTLFKKWKPGVNCVALDISSKDGCVLSGHENGHICIWDLTTGNCRWTLGGHMAPVTSLRLDPGGGSFISLDTHTRDHTIKLWSVTTGELVSEFTPAKPITAFEILPGGKFVVVASSGSSYPTVLQLRGPGSIAVRPTTGSGAYGDGTIEVDLSLDFREDAGR